jgi:ABC-2 type transport system permease protein
LLDKTKIANNKLFWQLLNTLLPVLLVIIFGIIWAWVRKRRYAVGGK